MAVSTRLVALAAPVDVGTMLAAAARARRGSLCGRSNRFWSFVYACTVVMSPLTMSKASSTTFTIGTRQFVVHDPFEITDVLVGVEVPVVDADDERGVGVGRRPRDDDPLDRAAQVLRGLRPVGEDARGLDHQLGPQRVPGQFARVTLGHDLDVAVADQQVGALDVDRHGETALGRVVAQQVRQHLGRGQVVDPDHLDVGPGVEHGAQEAAPDTAEAVDPDPHGHVSLSFSSLGQPAYASRPANACASLAGL